MKNVKNGNLRFNSTLNNLTSPMMDTIKMNNLNTNHEAPLGILIP